MTKRTFLVAVLIAMAGVAPPPACARGRVVGNTFSIAVDAFPERVYLGDTVRGTISITAEEDGADAAKPAVVQVYVETPMGRAVLSQSSLTVRPGQTRELRVSCDVDEHAATGPFTFGVQVLMNAEALELEHEVYVVGGK